MLPSIFLFFENKVLKFSCRFSAVCINVVFFRVWQLFTFTTIIQLWCRAIFKCLSVFSHISFIDLLKTNVFSRSFDSSARSVFKIMYQAGRIELLIRWMKGTFWVDMWQSACQIVIVWGWIHKPCSTDKRQSSWVAV